MVFYLMNFLNISPLFLSMYIHTNIDLSLLYTEIPFDLLIHSKLTHTQNE